VVAGSFVWVTLKVKNAALVQVPAAALDIRAKASQVGVVVEGKLKLRPVEVADLDGETVRLRSGLKVGELVALNLGDLEDGAPVSAGGPSVESMAARRGSFHGRGDRSRRRGARRRSRR